MTSFDIEALFARIARLRVGVIGDFAVDFYFNIRKETGEFSIETGKEVSWAGSPRASLGGAGNVVQNLAALGIPSIKVFGCLGPDLFGREMRHLFGRIGADASFLKVLESGWDTCTYTKPMAGAVEESRLDFGTHNILPDAVFSEILTDLRQTLPGLDLLIINQQFPNPLLNERRVGQLNELIAQFPDCLFVADMRDYGKQIRQAVLKVNTAELARLLNIPLPREASTAWCRQAGQELGAVTGGPVVITRGERGIVYVAGNEVQTVDGLVLEGELDTVGAGDTVVAAFAAAAGAGGHPGQALEVANLAAAVTVQKLRQTGTATLREILELRTVV